ncbi:hypothetical protein [Halalkalibacter alkalisediminis]|uniref:Uncharacterized protein n=1 Tax=Halalkalibacter alkalisediminis TaxID=935616 RepID=A0ABV6NCC6_9BACI|nr:hypothetical protein [Halalkalibacter alkalisediminis]
MKHVFSFFLLMIMVVGCQNETSPPNTVEDERLPEIEVDEENTETAFYEVVESYQPLTDYDMYHDGTGLGEGMNFLEQSGPYVLAVGHQGQAVAFYRILKIDDTTESIRITHEFMEATDEFESIQRSIDEGEELSVLLEQYQATDQNEDRLFFSANEQPETIILIPGEDLSVLPVTVNQTIYYFAEGRGLVQIRYTDDTVIELFGEEQVAESNPH